MNKNIRLWDLECHHLERALRTSYFFVSNYALLKTSEVTGAFKYFSIILSKVENPQKLNSKIFLIHSHTYLHIYTHAYIHSHTVVSNIIFVIKRVLWGI